MPEPNYGQNADLAAERDAILALPPDQMQRALLAFSQRRSGVPEIPGGYRNAEFAADLPAPTGRFAANIVPETRTAAAKTADVSDGSGAGTEAGGSGSSTTTPPPGGGSTTTPASGSYSAAMRAIGAMPEPLRGLAEQGIINQQRLEQLGQREGETQQRVRTEQAGGEARLQRDFATAQRTAAEQNAPRAIPAFVPTKETAADMGTLFSLLAVAGQALGGRGKAGAMSAMASMTGMLNGYRQGRQDLYQKERQNFEAGLRQIQAQNQALQEAYRRAQEAARTDMESARAQLQTRLVELGAPLVSIATERAGIQGGNQMLQNMMTVTGQVMARKNALQARAAQAEAQLPNQQPIVVPGEREGTFVYARRDGTPILNPQGQPVQAPAPRGSTPGSNAVQFRYNAAIADAAASASTDIQNLLSMPGTATPPVLRSYITDENKGVTGQLTAYMGQSFTSTEERATQQIMAGLTRAVTNIQAAGRPGGVTRAALEDFARTAPQPGDSRINFYLFLAMMKQEMDLAITSIRNGGGTEEQIRTAQEARDRVYAAVPYSVSDITRIISDGRARVSDSRTTEILQRSNRLEQAQEQIGRVANSPEEAAANEAEAVERLRRRGGGGTTTAPAAPAAPAPTGGGAAAPQPPPPPAAAGATYNSLEEITAAWRAGTLTREQAFAIAQQRGFTARGR
jgi:hypothetical protein